MCRKLPAIGNSTLFIHTVGRTTNFSSLHFVPHEWYDKTVLVIQEQEKDFWMEEWGEAIAIAIVPAPGLSIARQFIVDICKTQNAIMMDDDLIFAQRHPDWDYENLTKLLPLDSCSPILDWIDEKLNHYALAGIGARSGNNRIKERWEKENARVTALWGVDVGILKEHNIRLDKFIFWSDFHAVLSLLKLGYPNILSTNFTWDQGSNADGGCSEYRTRERLLSEREKFLADHGDVAKAVDKPTKSWKGFQDTVPDLRMQWKKAAKIGQELVNKLNEGKG